MKPIKILTLIVMFLSSFFPKVYAKECYVQVASFKNGSKAEKLLKEFDKKAFIIKVNVKGKEVYAVRLGPFKDSLECKSAAEKVKKEQGLKPMIIWSNRNYILSHLFKGKISDKNYDNSEKTLNKAQNRITSKVSDKSYIILLEKAKVCIGRRDCKNAVKYLKEAIKRNPDNPLLYVYLGYAYIHLNLYVEALQAFKKSLEVKENFPEAYAGIGYLYLKLRSPEAAVEVLKKAYELNPKEPSYAINYAISLLQVGKEEEALKVLDNLQKIYPFMPEIYYNKAIIYIKLNRLRKAKENLEKFLAFTKGFKVYNNYRSKVVILLDQINQILRSNS